MWYKIEEKTKTVESIATTHEELRELLGLEAKSNGQHIQLPGYVLAEWDGEEYRLFHPDTKARTGHVDIHYSPRRSDGEAGIDLNTYHLPRPSKGPAPEDLETSWPTGIWDLIATIVAIEEHIEKTFGGYQPKMRGWIKDIFRTS